MTLLHLSDAGVLLEPGDNVAIATRTLEPGTQVRLPQGPVTLRHTVLEGHRFLVRPTGKDEPLLFWSTPFARAQRDLQPGDYICTATSLGILQARGVTGLPPAPTAANVPLDPYRLDESVLHLGRQVDPVDVPRTFYGFGRKRGVAGTRNHVVVIGATSRSGAFVTEVARRFAGATGPGLDGVVPVAHTEGGEGHPPNNLEFLLAALAGFLVHPNVGAVMLVDEPDEPDGVVTGETVRRFMRDRDYPEITVPHAFLPRSGSFSDDLDRAVRTVEPWLGQVGEQRRTEQPLADLRVALQCGGSDAFSGITANPLAGAVGREVIRHGGAAVLAETDELIGAEGYVLESVRDVEVARAFLRAVESFKERVGWHGHSAEGNPSGGNVYRGLYNILLKSVGAARKKDRALRLDHVVGYGEPLLGPGFTFMDSPGNDLESVAGQVATGCTMVFFTTGNGSITNFPFVPTLKFVTTSARYDLLSDEMDVDAGRYLTGTPMSELTQEVFEQTVRAAGGTRTVGENAGHSQVSIWRNWKQTGPRVGADGVPLPLPTTRADEAERDAELSGRPLTGAVVGSPPAGVRTSWNGLRTDEGVSPEKVALVLPTSLCSGQIALRLAEAAEQQGWHGDAATRVVALPHTEGCGVSSGTAEETYARLMVGYLTHPNTRLALLLEHGCEKTHNDYFRSRLVEEGQDPDRFGWASIQRDGGLQAVSNRVREWFAKATAPRQAPTPTTARLDDLTLGLDARGPLDPTTAEALGLLGGWLVGAGGTVLLASRSSLAGDETFRRVAFGGTDSEEPTLAHGQRPAAPGWHVMRTPTTDWLETATGLGAGGAQLTLCHVAEGTVSGQRFVPVVQVTADAGTADRLGGDLDAVVEGDAVTQASSMLATLLTVASREQTPRAQQTRNVGFQITRGLLGTSM